MAKLQSGGDRKKTETERVSDLKHLLIAGSVVGGILLTLVIAAVLRVDPEAAATAVVRPSASDAVPAKSDAPAGEAAPDEREALGGDELARRALDDQRRLATTADEWTLQFMVTCKEETAERILDGTRGDRKLYLLPVLVEDRPCFRVCWDRYPSRERATSGSGVPDTLIALNDNPVPRQIRGLVP